MDGKIIDLSRYQGKGVTLIVNFINVTTPFLVIITDQLSNKVLYYRDFDKPRLFINLPKHSNFVNLVVDKNVKIKDVMITEIKKHKIKYSFNESIITPRKYRLDQIKTKRFPILTRFENNMVQFLNTPAQFIPLTGEKHIATLKFDPLPEPVQEYVLDHEEGHYFYGRPYIPDWYLDKLPISSYEKDKAKEGFKQQKEQDEEEADRYALYKFINNGYNFSGALNSLMDNLPSDVFSTKRIKKQFEEINRIHKLNEI